MKKLYYISNVRIPTEKAHGWQICRMCSEFAGLGHETELVAPNRNSDEQDLFEYYSLERNFKTIYLSVPNLLKLEKFDKVLPVKAIYLLGLFFLFKLFFFSIEKDSLIYTRNPEIAWLFGLKGRKVFYDAHSWPNSKTGLFKFLLKRTSGIVCNSTGTANAFKENGFNSLLVAPNAVDLGKFNINVKQEEAKKELDLPQDKKIIMYVGHLYQWKGVDVIFQAARELKNQPDYLFVLAGGTDKDIEKYNNIIQAEKLENIVLTGHKPQNRMAEYLKSADILLLPNVPVSAESEKYTSPIKMFEYMASKRLIVASNLSSLKEVLNKDNSILFKSGNARELAVKIDQALKNPNAHQDLIDQAFQDVQKYTWGKRAKKIEEFLQNTDNYKYTNNNL